MADIFDKKDGEKELTEETKDSVQDGESLSLNTEAENLFSVIGGNEEDEKAFEELIKELAKKEQEKQVQETKELEKDIAIQEDNSFKNKTIKTSSGNIDVKDLLKNKKLIEETIKLNEEFNKITKLNEDLRKNKQEYLSGKLDFQKKINDVFKEDKVILDKNLQNDIFKYQILNKDYADKLSHVQYINKELNTLNENRNEIKLEDIVAFKNKFENTTIKNVSEDKNGNKKNIFTKNSGLNYYGNLNDDESSRIEWETDYKKLEDDLKKGKLNHDVLDKITNKLKEKEVEIKEESKSVKEINNFISTNMESNKGKIESKNIFEITYKEYDQNTRKYQNKTINLLDDLESLNDLDSVNKKLDMIFSSNMNALRQGKVDFIEDYRKLLAEESQSRGKTFGDMNALDYISFYKMALYGGDTAESLLMLGKFIKESHKMNSQRQEIISKLEEFKHEKNSVLTKENGIIGQSGFTRIDLEELKLLEKQWLDLPGNEHKSIEQNSSEFNNFLQQEKVGVAFKENGLNLSAKELSIMVNTNTEIEEKRKALDNELEKIGINSNNINNFSKFIDENGKLDENKFRNEINKDKPISLDYNEIGDKIKKAIPLVENFIKEKQNLEKNSYIGMISFFDENTLDKEIGLIEEDFLNRELGSMNKSIDLINNNQFQNYKEKYKEGKLSNLEERVFLDSLSEIKKNVDFVEQLKQTFDNDNKTHLDLLKIYKNNEIENLDDFNKLQVDQKEAIANHLKIELNDEKNLPDGQKLKDVLRLNQYLQDLQDKKETIDEIQEKTSVLNKELSEYFYINKINENNNEINELNGTLLIQNSSIKFEDNISKSINSSENIIDVNNSLKTMNLNIVNSINEKNIKEIDYNEQELNQKLSNGINKLKENTTEDLKLLSEEINEIGGLNEQQKGELFLEKTKKSFEKISEKNESGTILLGLLKNSVAGLKKEDLTTKNIMDGWMKSGNVDFELGLKNILETFIFHKQEVKLMFDDMKKEGYLPNYVNPEHLINNKDIEGDSFKKYQDSFNKLNKYIEDNNIPAGLLKIDELNESLNNIANNNKVKDFSKELEIVKEKFLKSQYPDIDKMEQKERNKLIEDNYVFLDINGINKVSKTKDLYKKELESSLLKDPNFNSNSLILEDSLKFNEQSKNVINKIIEDKILSKEEVNRIEERVKVEKEKKERDQELAKELVKKDKEKEQEKQEQEQNGMSR